MELQPIAHIENDFSSKFGLPRQSGMSKHLISRVVMEEDFRNPEAFRGIEEFDYLWLIWLFEPMGKREWSPTVRPPKLGGNKRMGVFATRSPNRPNPIGLTKVRLVSVEKTAPDSPALVVAEADLMSGTKILDIKPYLPYADSAPEAATGPYGPQHQNMLKVELPDKVAALFSGDQISALNEVLEFDPRPGYQSDPERIYGFPYGGYDIKFKVSDGILTVIEAVKLDGKE